MVIESGVRHENNQVFDHISSLDIDADGLYVERFGVKVRVLSRIRKVFGSDLGRGAICID